jgi:glucose/arabinose dehydrogenase/plastocyanin
MKFISKALLVCLCGLGFLSHHRVDAATTVVGMSGFSFMPSSVTIQVGDTVTWTNVDVMAHTTTSGANPPTNDGLWNSGILNSHQAFSHTFTQAGSFPYFCEIHFGFGMLGSVTVQGGEHGPPTVSLTSPTNGATYVSPANLMISATASESGGSISQVQFFDGTNSLGVVSANPYTLAATLYPGIHDLEAVATDSLGASATSSVATVTVTTGTIPDPVSNHIVKGDITIELKTILAGLVSPLGFAMPDDGSGRMFVYDQAGLAHVVIDGNSLPTPLVDLRNRIVPQTTYDERGFLGLATHPNFAQHPLVYTFTSEPVSQPPDFTFPNPGGFTNCQSVLAEWRMDPVNTNQVDLSSRRELLRLDKPYLNHNGGEIRFGADGFLYISTGDGGLANDVGAGHLVGSGNAQSLQEPYGKILRIDVSGTNSANGHYGIPVDNPFVGQNAVHEIYAYGLRNPYRFSFDSQTGDLYCSDAGQNTVEEVDLIVKGGNYGWNVKEGGFWFDSIASDTNFGSVVTGPVKPVPPNLMDPLLQYDHFEGQVVIGGFVYRGTQIPQLQGRYVFADWGSFFAPTARLFYLDTNNVIKEFHIGLDDRRAGIWVKGFGQDTSGEIYVFGSRALGPAGNTGVMLKIVPPPPPLAIANSHFAGGTNLAVAWTGGAGPFALQEKLSLQDSSWVNASFTTNAQTSVPLAARSAFFRVADTVSQPPTPFTATLSGAAEQPNPVTTAGNGLGVFDLNGNTLRFSMSYSGLSGPATAADINGPAGTDGSGPVILHLEPFTAGPLAASGAFSGTLVISDQFKSLILSGQTYVNVHTAGNPGGEIRGQIAPALMQSSLSGAYEVPPVTGNGNAFGEFGLVGNQLSFSVAYRNLSAAVSSADLRGPASIGSNAPVLLSLISSGEGSLGTNGVVSGAASLDPVELSQVLSGLTYINIGTASHPGGEIRGQLMPQTVGVPLSVSLSGAAEQPIPVSTGAVGSGLLSMEGETLRFSLSYSGLSGPAVSAQIHAPATSQQTALVIIDLAPFNGGSYDTSGQLSGSVHLTPTQRDAVSGGMAYVEITTANNPGGEIRGQLAPMLMQSDLSGVNEVPNSVASSGAGYGAFLLVGNQLTFDLSYMSLPIPATAASINGPASLFAPGPVLIDLAPFNGGGFDTFGALTGSSSLVVSNLNSLIDGMTYVNMSTATNTTGEIRGQIGR